ncbi:MAG: transcription-repair coupling factor, partial [Elusimicrobia bacterium]|nr:transcription-repair coupling factor [Elusimicrobiota bacterium]
TIIESGLDIPSVNTLLVEDAQDFGLAQLYQLRGRIGREQQRACCYLFFPEGHEDASLLSEDARKRLEALKEFGALGAGIRLALRDLEIRGAGELLGARQHGLINAVGAEFYSQMLDEEVTSRQGRAKPPERRLRLDLPLQAFIPEAYLPDESRRLDFYKKILRAGENDAQSISRELEDLCGPLPQPARNLLRLIPLRAAAIRSGICSISQSGRLLTILFSEGAPIEPSAPARWSQAYKGRLRFLHGPEGDGVEAGLDPGEDAVAWLEGFLAV